MNYDAAVKMSHGDGFHHHDAEQNTTEPQDNILHNSIYRKFKNKQNSSMMLKVRRISNLGWINSDRKGTRGPLLGCWH